MYEFTVEYYHPILSPPAMVVLTDPAGMCKQVSLAKVIEECGRRPDIRRGRGALRIDSYVGDSLFVYVLIFLFDRSFGHFLYSNTILGDTIPLPPNLIASDSNYLGVIQVLGECLQF